MTLVNVDPLNPAGQPSPDALIRAGFRGVRLVSRQGVQPYVGSVQDAGLMVLAVITEQSGGFLCPADVYQIGNEPDLAGTADTRSAADYVSYWNLYRDTYPDPIMIGAGLASGQTPYWKAVQSAGGLHGCSGFAVHPYGKNATTALALLLQYRAVTVGMPLWVTEWNRPAAEVADFAAMLEQTDGIVQSAWFCWSDSMVPGFGLSPQQGRILGAA